MISTFQNFLILGPQNVRTSTFQDFNNSEHLQFITSTCQDLNILGPYHFRTSTIQNLKISEHNPTHQDLIDLLHIWDLIDLIDLVDSTFKKVLCNWFKDYKIFTVLLPPMYSKFRQLDTLTFTNSRHKDKKMFYV